MHFVYEIVGYNHKNIFYLFLWIKNKITIKYVVAILKQYHIIWDSKLKSESTCELSEIVLKQYIF